MLNVNRIITSTKVEGPGIRTCIWLQGCSRHCKGCFATDMWSFEKRNILSCEEIMRIILDDTYSEGITILGGEPLEQIDPLIELCQRIRSIGKTIVLFTGYSIAEIEKNERLSPILDLVDVLVDGPYIEELKDYSQPMTGSSNQQFHFLSSKYKIEDFQRNKLELRILPSGKVVINGQGKTVIFSKTKENFNDIQ